MHTRWNLVLVLMILLAPFAGMAAGASEPTAQMTAPLPQEPPPPSPPSSSAADGAPALTVPTPRPQAVTALGDDELVNDPTGETTSLTQNNAVVAYNDDTGALCAAYNDSYHGHVEYTGWTGFSSSVDGGAMWVDRGAVTGGPGESYGSPTLVWRRADGHFYLATLYSNGLGLWDMGAGCDAATWLGMIYSGNNDKMQLAVDNQPASPYYGRLYAVWLNNTNGHIYVARSGDAGQIWSAPADVSGHAQVAGAWPAVDPTTGAVYVAWTHWDAYPDGPIDIEMARSTNGGAAWTPLPNPMSGQVNPRDATASAAGNCNHPALNGNIRYSPYPQIAVDHNSVLHAVYSYDPDGYDAGDVVNVYYRRSLDQGATWETEIKVNDNWNTTDQFSPALAVGETGAIGVFWYDRRLDASNNLLYDRYMALSRDSGATFSANQRLSDESSPVVAAGPGMTTCYHGDYDGAAAGGGHFYTVWGDDRRGASDVWSDSAPYFWGHLSGTVYDATTLRGLSGAAVATVHTPTGTPFTTAGDGVGSYEMILPGDATYTVTGHVYGYAANTVTATVDVDGGRGDIPLTPAAFWDIAGQVTDANTGYPVYARLTVTGDPLNPPAPANETWSAPFTGVYGLNLAGAISYTLTIAAEGYLSQTYNLGELSAHLFGINFALQPDLVACTAPGYQMTPPCEPADGAVLQPAFLEVAGCPCETQSHTLSFANHSGAAAAVLLSYASSAGVSVELPASLGVVPDTGVKPFDVALKLDRGIVYSTTVAVTVTASLASNPAISDTTVITQRALDPIAWEARRDSPTPSQDGAVIEYNGKLYNVGGYGSNGAVDIYDPATDSWTTGAAEPTPTINHPGDACFGYVTPTDPVILLLPDTDSGTSGVWYRYHIISNTWDTPDLPAPLPANGIWASDIVVDEHANQCYITGGATTLAGGNLTTLYRYDPAANAATLLGNFTHIPGGFNFHAGWYVPWIGTAGGVCVGGGINISDVVYADTQCYDIAAATFNTPNADLGPLPQPWWGMADMEEVHNGEYQLWLANGIGASGDPFQDSAYFGQNVGRFVYGPDLINRSYRVEGASVNGEMYVVDGAPSPFNPTTRNERLRQCSACDCGVAIAKDASADWVYTGDVISYTVVITRPTWLTGTATLADRLPAGVEFAGGLSASAGTAWYSDTARAVYWTPAPPLYFSTPGALIETFTNTWATNAMGLVYNPQAGYTRYVHESSVVGEHQMNDVAYPAPHALLHSFNLSEANAGWPASQNWRSGAGYDTATGHYFLTDCNGGGSHDDNLIETDAAGRVLNAWETVGANNNSYDGASLNNLIDIAVVPGTLTRYFATVLFDGGLVYELDLRKAGQFVDDTWGKVMTCTVPSIGDTAGIDYDAQNGVLYHSDWNSNAVVVTDLSCNVLASFTCGASGAQNSGITFIAGQWPPEVWAMDYLHNTTTRCEAVGHEPLPDVVTVTFNVTVTAPAVTTLTNTALLEYTHPAARPLPAILHLRTTDTSASVQRALDTLGYTYDTIYAQVDWTGIDFTPYDVVIIGMTGGLLNAADIQKIRTDVIDQGKRAIVIGGSYYASFVNGVNQYLVENDTTNYAWTPTASPHFTLIAPHHPLAQGLPITRDFINNDLTSYQLRVTDPAIEIVAQNGDGYPSYFRKTYPGDGELIWFIHRAIGTAWNNPVDLQLLPRLIGNALPEERVAVAEHTLHVTPHPAFTWTTEVYINGNYVGRYNEGPFTVVPADDVQIVDRLDYVGRAPLFVQLTEDWAAYPVALAEEYHTRGAVTSSDGDWAVTLTPGTSVRLVKTLHITDTVPVTIYEWLHPDGMASEERGVTFQPPQFALNGPAVAYNGQLITYTLTFTSQNPLLGALRLTDTLPAGVEYVSGLTASYGHVEYHAGDHAIYWTNTPASALTRARNLSPSPPLPLSPAPLSPSASWHNAAPLPQGVFRYAHAQCPGEPNRFYIISGAASGYTDKVWRYDADTDTWTALAPFPRPGEGAAAVCYQGKIYVAGGIGGMNRFFIYDIARDAWVEGPGLPRHVWGAALGAWDGRLYLAGGDNDIVLGGASDAVNIYNIAAETWEVTGAAMPTATFLPGWVQVNETLYVVGGFGVDAAANIAVTQRYNMAGNSWETGPAFTSARADFTLAATNQYLYAIGGDADAGGLYNAATLVERLDYTAWNSAAWTDISDPLPTALTAYGGGFCTTAQSGGEIWSVGGLIPSPWAYTNTHQYRPSEPCVTIPPTVTLSFTAQVTANMGQRITNTAQMNVHGAILTATTAFDVPLPDWQKRVNDVAWQPGFSVTIAPGDMLTVTDVVSTSSAFTLCETWDSDQLELLSVITPAVVALSAPAPNKALPPYTHATTGAAPEAEDTFDWVVPAGASEPLTLTKVFRVKPGDWTQTTLSETLIIGSWMGARPVTIRQKHPTFYTLTVATAGTGSGAVAPPVGLHSYPEGTTVVLTATADADSTFAGWSGAAGGAAITTSVLMDANQTVTATFNLTGVCEDVTDVMLMRVTTGVIYTDTVVQFRATISPTTATPYTYTLDYGAGAGAPGATTANPLSWQHTFPTTGTHTVTFTAWSCAMTTPITRNMVVPVFSYDADLNYIYLPLVLRSAP
ncbi:MAG TPA: hypothetical protein PKH77_03765 [Anaerolineae bacterium]|nr:hypothetical protein [Anaerolineae bacterium]